LCRTDDKQEAIKRTIQLRDRLNDGFNAVKAQSDAVVFEFGPSRQRKLKIRDDFRRWQPTIGTLMEVQITYLQYLFQQRLHDRPQAIATAQIAFEENLAEMVRAMADEVCGKPPRTVADIQASAATLRGEIAKQYGPGPGAIPPPLPDMIILSQNLASIVEPLYANVHATFTDMEQAAMHNPQGRLREG
jgi:multidrug resistance protein MdtO